GGVGGRPAAAAAWRPSKKQNPPMGKRLSPRCKRASSGRVIEILVIMAVPRGDGRERERRASEGNALPFEELLDAGDLRADDRAAGDHHRLMPIADVVREERP